MNNFGVSGFALAGWALAVVFGAYLVLGRVADDPQTATVSPMPAIDGPATLEIEALPDALSGYNLWIKTRNFTFAPEHANAELVPGEGHAHLYVNGEKTRVYAPWVHLPDRALVQGQNHIVVELNDNQHGVLMVDDTPVSAMLMLDGPDPIAVRGAWVRSVVPLRPAALYFTIANNTDAAIDLVGGQSADFGMVMIHQTVDVDGVMKMNHLEGLKIAPGDTAQLQEGGTHVMLMKPTRELAEGDEVAVTLTFADGTTLDIAAPVSKAPPAGLHDHAAHGHEMDHQMNHDTDQGATPQ